MLTETFPAGVCALHPDWPEARFNISGMFVHHPLIFQLLQILEKTFDCHLPMEAIHGAPAVAWNAGRISRAPLNLSELNSALDFLYSRNIGYYPTFTNHLIEPADLDDPVCNQLLDLVAQRPDLNKVIVTSEILCRYISQRYPALPLIASITKVAMERGNGNVAYYQELGRRFNRYVVHPDDCLNPALLDQLDRAQAEVILNENCAANCPNRTLHFDAYARMQRAASPLERQQIQQEIQQIISRCHSPFPVKNQDLQERSCNMTRTEVKAVYDLGFRHLKLQGRSDDPWSFAFDVTRYTLDPDFVAPLVYKRLLKWLEKVVVKVAN